MHLSSIRPDQILLRETQCTARFPWNAAASCAANLPYFWLTVLSEIVHGPGHLAFHPVFLSQLCTLGKCTKTLYGRHHLLMFQILHTLSLRTISQRCIYYHAGKYWSYLHSLNTVYSRTINSKFSSSLQSAFCKLCPWQHRPSSSMLLSVINFELLSTVPPVYAFHSTDSILFFFLSYLSLFL